MYSAFTAYNSQQPQIPTSITSIDKSTLHYYDTSELDYDRSIPEVVREDSNFSNYTFTENEDLIKYNQIRNSVYTYEEFIAVIQLRSPSENVGFSIGQNDDDLPYIEEITEESPAARANLITSDEIIEVNSIPVTSLGYYETIDLIRDVSLKKLVQNCLFKVSNYIALPPKKGLFIFH
uniref:PDZ domain-containing protein n=1 Tax=Rhabditophanes sp. KR3021 TaxID=114890 RepID=A0AC35TI63_9BILA